MRRRVISIAAVLAATSGLLSLYFFTIRPGGYEYYGFLPAVALPAFLAIVAVGLVIYALSENIYGLTEGWVTDHSSDEDYLSQETNAMHGGYIDLDHMPRFYLHVTDRGHNKTGRPRTGKIGFETRSIHTRYPVDSYYQPEVQAEKDVDEDEDADTEV